MISSSFLLVVRLRSALVGFNRIDDGCTDAAAADADAVDEKVPCVPVCVCVCVCVRRGKAE